ncbi:hypothetical protein RF11_07085 [Thelohanellus kitauei]|uniref:Uncharacterized protein n=1 Tax=Thelohanellus kitauei TaxID=669202 RepID=A0A0C2IZF1_THEKT|nr:hypothetical protein RF11_07085 [Thelohanellus kitauei]
MPLLKQTRNPQPYRSPKIAHIICMQEHTLIQTFQADSPCGYDLIFKHLYKMRGSEIYHSLDIERPKFIESEYLQDTILIKDIYMTNFYKPQSDFWLNGL